MSELAGTKKVIIDYKTDQFTVSYDATLIDPEAMMNAIKAIHYRPHVVESTLSIAPDKPQKNQGGIPEPIASAIQNVSDSSAGTKLLFVDFYAEWCGACKIMDRTTLIDPSILKSLEQYEFVKVDADIYPDATKYFGVHAMPTYIILNSQGDELYRHVGPMEVKALNDVLETVY